MECLDPTAQGHSSGRGGKDLVRVQCETSAEPPSTLKHQVRKGGGHSCAGQAASSLERGRGKCEAQRGGCRELGVGPATWDGVVAI